MKTSIEFHWSPYPDDNSEDTTEFVDLCSCAEAYGFESVHVPRATCLSKALALARAAGLETARVRFRIGWDFESVLASLLGPEMKEAWAALEGRLIFHMSFTNEATVRNGYYAQAEEFLMNCRRLFDASAYPQFDVEGETAEVAFVGIKQADCLWRLPNRPIQVYADALPVLHFGKNVGLVSSVVARETLEEARETAARTLAGVGNLDDAAGWLTPYLWTGNISTRTEKVAALVGSFDEVALAMHGFKKHGIIQFLVRGGHGEHDLECFGKGVLPLVRTMEAAGVPVE